MLLNNNNILNSNPGREVGGPTDFKPFRKGGTNMSFYCNEIATDNGLRKSSFSNGYRPPYCWILSPKSGGLVSRTIEGTGTINYSNLAGLKQAVSEIYGTTVCDYSILNPPGYISSDLIGISVINADMAGLVSMASDLLGTSDTVAILTLISSAVCSIIGEGVFNVDITGGAPIYSDITGEAIINTDISGGIYLFSQILAEGVLNGDITAHGNMSAEIFMGIKPEELSPSSLAAAVWNALANEYNHNGSFGETLINVGSGSSPDDIADAVWDELLTTHNIKESAGKKLRLMILGENISKEEIANMVWNEQISGHTTPGSAGRILKTKAKMK
jgi:hypothetical protein